MVRIEFNIAPAIARLNTTSALLGDLTQLHQVVGEYVVEATKERFRSSTAPDGTKWRDKRPATIARYLARGDGNKRKPLIGATGRLGREIAQFTTRKEVEIGSALEYSGVMQDGAAKGAFGNDKRGRPLPWGNIPARVWLGLSDTDERNILDIIDEHDVPAALQSALAPIAALVGVAATADAAAVLAGVQQLKAGGDDTVVTALQSELATLTTNFNTLSDATLRKDATAFVDGAIAAGRVGVKPMRDRYITMHMADPAGTAELIGAMPAIKGGASLGGTPPADAKDGLGEADLSVIALMGIDRAEYVKTLGAEKEASL